MKPYSQFLYQAGQGKNAWTKYLLLFGLAWWGSYVAEKIAIATLQEVTDAKIWTQIGQSNVIRDTLALFTLLLLFQYIHKRHPITLINTLGKPNWKKLGLGFIVSAGLIFGLSAISMWVIFDQPFIWQWNTTAEYGPGFHQNILFVPLAVLVYKLFFGSYLLQGAAIWRKKPIQAILYIGLLTYLISFSSLFWFQLTSGFDAGMNWQWFFNASFFMEFAILVIIVLDEGIELALSFSLGRALFSMLVDESAMYKAMLPGDDTFSFSYTYSFTYGWGSFLYFALFVFIITRKYKLRDRSILFEPIPPHSDETYDLIDQIGQK